MTLKDAAKRGITSKDLDDIVNNFSAGTVPVLLGHKSDYDKFGSRAPAAGWLGGVRRDDENLYATITPLPALDKIPQEFSSLKPFFEKADFLREVNNKGYFPKRSIGLVDTENGKALHHLGLLGATIPQCKGMPDVELAGDAKNFIVEFSTDANNLIEFDAMDDILTTLADLLGVDPSLSEEELLGILKKKKADADKAAIEANALVNGNMWSPSVAPGQIAFNDLERAVVKVITDIEAKKAKDSEFSSLQEKIKMLETKIQEFEDTPPAPATPTVESLGLSEEDAKKKAAEAKATLTAANNWLPAFDEKGFEDLLAVLANVKVDSGSALDKLMDNMSAISGLTEMMDLFGNYSIIEMKEMRPRAEDHSFKAPKGSVVVGDDISAKVEEYMEQNKGVSYIEATNILSGQGKI